MLSDSTIVARSYVKFGKLGDMGVGGEKYKANMKIS
jgi:hypothetical protein